MYCSLVLLLGSMLLQIAGTLAEADQFYASGNLKDASERYRQLLATDPQNPVWLAKLGASEYLLGASEQAVVHLQSALAIQPALHPARLALGGALLDLKKPSEAIQHLEQFTARMPQYREARRLLGRAYQETNRFFEGEQTLLEVVKQTPDDWQSWTYLGTLLYNNNYYARALDALRTALKIEAANPRARLLEASSLAHLGRYDEAGRVYGTLLVDPRIADDPELLLGYTQFLLETGRSGEALAPIERAVAAVPGEAKLHFWHARVLSMEGKLEAAAKSARKSIELAPDQPNARNLLLNLARSLGERDEVAIQAKWLNGYNGTQKKVSVQ